MEADVVAAQLGWRPEPGRFHLFRVDIDDVTFIHWDDLRPNSDVRHVEIANFATPAGNMYAMASKFEQSAEPFVGKVAQITRGGVAAIVSCPPGPPKRIDGYTVGVIPNLEGPAPHRGEVHPDGDELLYLVSGAIEVVLDDGDEHSIGAETTVVLRKGDALVVPRGVWHQVRVIEPAYFVHVTPGPNGSARPL